MKTFAAKFIVAVFLAWAVLGPGVSSSTGEDYDYATKGTLCFGPNCGVKILLDRSNLGSDELEMAEISFPVGYEGQAHPHGSMEIFYVLEGRFGHEVNGEFNVLDPGMVGVVKPGDTVKHSVIGDQAVRVLVVWVPGGEVDRIFDRSQGMPVE